MTQEASISLKRGEEKCLGTVRREKEGQRGNNSDTQERRAEETRMSVRENWSPYPACDGKKGSARKILHPIRTSTKNS